MTFRTIAFTLLAAVGLAAAGLATFGPGRAEALEVEVLDRFVLGQSRLAGEKVGEFSALVRDPDGGGVLALSDRGYLVRIAVEIAGDRLVRVEPVALHILTGPGGRALRDEGFNPEGAALLDDGTIAVVSENGPRLAVFDREGRWLRDEALPEALRDAARQASPKDGIEALAWTAAAGFIAATEEPQAGEPRHLHALHGIGPDPVVLSTLGMENTSIKAMEITGQRLLVLERSRNDVTSAPQPWLREVRLDECRMRRDCAGVPVPVLVPGLDDADFEGLAALGDGRFLLVSDDKVQGDLRSVFLLVRVR